MLILLQNQLEYVSISTKKAKKNRMEFVNHRIFLLMTTHLKACSFLEKKILPTSEYFMPFSHQHNTTQRNNCWKSDWNKIRIFAAPNLLNLSYVLSVSFVCHRGNEQATKHKNGNGRVCCFVMTRTQKPTLLLSFFHLVAYAQRQQSASSANIVNIQKTIRHR